MRSIKKQNKSNVLLYLAALNIVFGCCIGCEKKHQKDDNNLVQKHIAFDIRTYKAYMVNQFYSDSMPKEVFFYGIDSSGKQTDEVIGVMEYYEDTIPYLGGHLKEFKRDGLWQAYHRNGNVQTEGRYVNGKEEGLYRVFHENGQLYYSGQYRQGEMVGEWTFYDTLGQKTKTENYSQTNK